MRAKDLRKYKTLDITELSGSPWNDAEKVLGLDQDDKVIMAEPDAVVTPEDVDEAINQAMEVETARTEDTYAKKSEVPDLDDYYTKEEVDEAISGITVDLSDYYTKDETDQAISAATQDLASTDYVDDAIAAIPEPDLSDYYTKDETDGAISTALVPYATKGWVSSQSYANQNYVMFKVNEAMQTETARTESTYAKPSDIPSLDGYATEEYVDDAIAAIPPVDLSSYAKTTAVTQDIQTAMAAETARTESTYLKEHQSLDNYYTKSQVDAEITGATEGLASEQYVNDAIATAITIDSALSTGSTNPVQNQVITNALDNKAEKTNVAANTNSRYFPQWNSDGIIIGKFGNIVYNVGHSINGVTYYIYRDKNSGALPAIYAPTSAGTQGQLLVSTGGEPVWSDNNFVTSGDVANQIDASMAAETARTESTYLKEHQSLDNYYTKSEVDADFVSAATAVGNAIDAAVQGLASETYVNNAVAGLASESYVDDAVSAATEGMATQEYVDNAVAGIDFPSDYATTGDVASAVEGLASESYVDDAISTATQGMATQSDLEGLASESYVDDAVNGVVQGIGMLGMVNDVSESNGTVTVQKTTMQEGQLVTGSTSFNIATPGDIQTAIASETARTESTYLKEHQSLDNYYTKSEVDAEITGATEDMATKTWVGQQGYLTQHQDISGKLDKTDFDTYTGATETALAEKLDTTAFTQGMASETARTESVYAKKSEIPSLNGYATEAWVEGKGYITGVTVDDELTSGSTNAVQSKAIYEALNGVSSSTQMEISEVTSNNIYASVNMSGFKTCYFKETNIPGYYVLDINQTVQDYSFTGNSIRLNGIFVGTTVYNRVPQTVYLTTENYGDIIKLSSSNGSYLVFQIGENLMDNFNYYLIYNSNENSIFFSKTVPIITTVGDHKANLSDLPIAQDGSGFNQFVYQDTTPGFTTKNVLQTIGFSNTLYQNTRAAITISENYWNAAKQISTKTFSLYKGNEVVDGQKTPEDSKVINKAEEALNGFTEQITLTLGSASTDSFNLFGKHYFYETDNSRYLAYPVSEVNRTGVLIFDDLSISGVDYYPTNGFAYYYQDSPSVVDFRGVYQLSEKIGNKQNFYFIYPSQPELETIPYVQYIIVDKETKTVILSDSLTFTRAKRVDNIVRDVATGYTAENPIVLSNTQTAWNATLATPDWSYSQQEYFKETNYSNIVGIYVDHSDFLTKGLLTYGFGDGYNNWLFPENTTGTTPDVRTQLATSGNGYYNVTPQSSPYYLLLDTVTGEFWFSFNPTVSTEVPGILDDYWTTGETQSAITAATQNYVTSGDVATQIGTAMASETARTESTYAKPSQIPSLNGYATEQWVQNQGYLTQHQSLANYYTKTEIDGMIGDIESLLASI